MQSETGIRTLDPSRDDEIELVARRMRETLIEVLGNDQGGNLYTHDWLVHRVRQHLNPSEMTGQVFVSELADSTITGHTIVRLDTDADAEPVGLFSTIFVAPVHRRQGIAAALLTAGEQWMRDHHMPRAVTYTDRANVKLHALFDCHGYALSPMPDNFVALSKPLVDLK